MLRLASRQKPIPGGLQFRQPEVPNFKLPPYGSFQVCVDAIIAMRQGNPFMAQKNKWAMDQNAVANELDFYNARICQAMGWTDYIIEEGPADFPKFQPSLHQETLQNLAAAAVRSKELVRGAKSLVEWEVSGDPAVSRDLATSRALTCSTCPKNESGDWTRWFTVPAAELIKRNIERAQSRNLSTVYDEKLQFCSACNCPLRLKVHVPIKWIAKRLTPEMTQKLKEAPKCWVLEEIPPL